MQFHVITLMPEMFDALSNQGVVGRALDRGLADLRLWNPRDYTHDVHRTVDDRPYGGGPGMLMKYEPLRASIEDARKEAPGAEVIYLSPQGRRFNQQAALDMAKSDRDWILICGRYEGIDERVILRYVDAEWSVGDYVTSGGELPAMVLMDTVIRLLPGVLGAAESAEQDSFMEGLLDCPHYTRPVQIDGMAVPAILQSGNHELIRRWRLRQALQRTLERRPDLLRDRELTPEETDLLDEIRATSGDVE